MPSLNVALPEILKDYVEERAREGGYQTPGEFMRELILDDQKRNARKRLETLLLEGETSGPAVEMTDQDWEDIRREGLDLMNQHRDESLSR